MNTSRQKVSSLLLCFSFASMPRLAGSWQTDSTCPATVLLLRNVTAKPSRYSFSWYSLCKYSATSQPSLNIPIWILQVLKDDSPIRRTRPCLIQKDTVQSEHCECQQQLLCRGLEQIPKCLNPLCYIICTVVLDLLNESCWFRVPLTVPSDRIIRWKPLRQ